MRAALLLLTIALPARAGVAVSAEAGAEASVPRISLQTSLVPMSGPMLGSALLAAPSLMTTLPAPAPLPNSAIPAAARPVTISAPSTPEAPQGVPTKAATPAPAAAPAPEAEPGAPSFKVKILGMLRGLANPFGNKGVPGDEPPPKSEAERLDREFTKFDVWSKAGPAAAAEIVKLRAGKPDKAAVKEYVRKAGREAMERIKAAAGTGNVGFHYNLHGGRREDYVGAGIRATMGDIALNYTTHGDTNYKVYFFQSARHELYDLLDESHPQIMVLPSRMGSVLNLFNVEAPELKAAMADGRVKNFNPISMDFHGMKGVPYSAYAAPPLEVFNGTAKKVGIGRLSRDEETLATIRYLEAAAAAGGAYIPR